MRKRILGCAAVLALAGGGSQLDVRAADSARSPCCFTNPQYSGVCRVEPAEGETCDSALAYLNTPNSQGRTYCDNSSIRGGWARQKCDGQGRASSE